MAAPVRRCQFPNQRQAGRGPCSPGTDPDTRKESTAYLMAFAEDCKKYGNSPCTGIADRAVDLCV